MTGGLLGCAVMILMLTALRFVGFALASVLRAAGTASASLCFDHFGCLGMATRRVTCRRLAGIALLLLGACLSVAHELRGGLAGRRLGP